MSEAVEVNAADLVEEALDWAVAQATGSEAAIVFGALFTDESCGSSYSPSTDWRQGGPLVERYNIDFSHTPSGIVAALGYGSVGGVHQAKNGHTMLIAAMRCLVTASLGDTVLVPAELLVSHS